MILTYRHRSGPGSEWEDVREPVPLTWTACNFGGERPWFICPGAGCGRRVANLYGPGRYFLCRRCYDLVYESQRGNGMYRALHKAQSIRERLGESASMMKPFPERPKGMHHETYWRLREEHDEAEMEQLAGMREWLEKLGEEGGIVSLGGFVWQFLGTAVGDTEATVAGSVLACPLSIIDHHDE